MIGYCQGCKDKTIFKILKTYSCFNNEDHLPIEFSFAQCSSCNLPSVFTREDFGAGFEQDNYSRVFPKNERHVNFELPKLVRDSYMEAVRCEEAKIWTAAVVMVGRALEAVCKEFVPHSKNIFMGLNTMREQGLISEEIMDWARELRILRNIGIHAYITLPDDTKEALDFLQAILRILYYLRPKFKRMKARRRGN